MRSSTARPRLRTLVLDRDEATAGLTRSALERCHVEALSALDGQSGVGLLLEELLHLDVLVVDLDLPGRDGWSFIDLIRRAGGERDLAIVVAATGAARVRGQLLALGADAVVERTDGPGAAAEAVLRIAQAAGRSGVRDSPGLLGRSAAAAITRWRSVLPSARLLPA
jgi:CheY-like chemotaxis protein